jgi:hypothetical protein
MIFFPKNPTRIAERLVEIKAGRPTDGVFALVRDLKKKRFSTFVFEDPGLGPIIRENMEGEVKVDTPSDMGQALRASMCRYRFFP